MTWPLHVGEPGRLPYDRALALQERLVARRHAGACPDTLLLLEHDPVYTLGRNAKETNVLVPEADLNRQGAVIRRTGRGGDVTYHGPGQLVGYAIVDLGARRQGVLWHVANMETVIIRTLADFGVVAGTDSINRGVWIGPAKIAAIGVRVTRHIAMHGFALNIRTDLAAYHAIVPCGLRDRGVTSLHEHLPAITLAAVQERLLAHFIAVYECDPVTRIATPDLLRLLEEPAP